MALLSDDGDDVDVDEVDEEDESEEPDDSDVEADELEDDAVLPAELLLRLSVL